jgi:ABC-type phosphate transport system ATPase subunit
VIRSVSFTNFQGLTTPEPLPLSKFTVLIGLNGSGKTTVLRALHRVLEWTAPCLRKIPSGHTTSIEVTGRGSASYFEYEDRKAVFSRCGEFRYGEYRSVLVDDDSVARAVKEWEEDAEDKAWLSKLPREYAEYGSLSPELSDSSTKLSRGMRYLLAIHYLRSKAGRRGPLLLDDFGSSMHVALAVLITANVANWRQQIVVSTHSIDVLAELVVGNYNFTVLRLRRDGEKVTAEQLSADEVDRYFEGGIDPRKVFGGASEG